MRNVMVTVVIAWLVGISFIIPIFSYLNSTEKINIDIHKPYLDEYKVCEKELDTCQSDLKEDNTFTCVCPESSIGAGYSMAIGFIFGVLAMGYYLIVVHEWIKKKIDKRKKSRT